MASYVGGSMTSDPQSRARRGISVGGITRAPKSAPGSTHDLHGEGAAGLCQRYEHGILLVARLDGLAIHLYGLWRGGEAAQLQAQFLALRRERALALADADGDAAPGFLAGDGAPGVLPVLVAVAVARVLVQDELAVARVRGRVDEEGQGIRRALAGVARLGAERYRGVGLDVERGLAQRSVGEDVGGSVETLAGPVVEPGTLRQVDVAVLDAGAGYGGDEQGVAEEELVVGGVGGLVPRVLEEEGTEDGGAGPVALLEEGVEVGEEALPELDHLAVYRLVGLPEGPRLLAAGAYGGVVPAEGLEDAELRPPGQEFGVRVAPEAADVHPGPADAGEPQVLELGHAHPQVLPPGGVVPRPLHRVALEAGVAGACDYERPLVGPDLQETLAGGASHQGAVGVVDLGVELEVVVARMHHVAGHGGLSGDEERRLVHVAPDPRDASVQERPVVVAPPLAGLGVREVREGTHPRPDDVVVLLAVLGLAVEVPLAALDVDRVVLVYLYAGVDYGHDPEALFP